MALKRITTNEGEVYFVDAKTGERVITGKEGSKKSSDQNKFDVVFESQKMNSAFPLSGKGTITIEKEEIIIKGYLNKWWKSLLIIILVLPIFGVSGLLVGYLLGRVDPGQWSIVEWLLALVVTYLFLKLISPKSTLSISRSTIRDIRQMGDNKISFDAVHPEKEKVGTIIVKFKSLDKTNNFMNGI